MGDRQHGGAPRPSDVGEMPSNAGEIHRDVEGMPMMKGEGADG